MTKVSKMTKILVRESKESGLKVPDLALAPEGASMVLPPLRQSAGVMEYLKISNSKHQITNKSQIPILNDQNKKRVWNFEFWSL